MKQLIKGALEFAASRLGPHRFSSYEPRLWVLMYHRILPPTDPRFAQEEPGMVVTPASFCQQLRTLKHLFEPMFLSEWIERRAANKTLPPRACAVTFDDGWLDNYEFALPILRKEQVPSTLFAVSHMIGTTRQFWPNRLIRVLNTNHCRLNLDWLPGYKPQDTFDREQIAQYILRCKQLSDAEISMHLDAAEARLQLPTIDLPSLMNWEQLLTMQSSGVEIGSHTGNHYRLLENLSAKLVEEEICQSKKMLQEQLDKPVKLFCYPNGDACPVAIQLVQQHYLAAVTTQRGINGRHTAAHNLQRIGIHEDIGSTPTRFAARLSGWV